MEQHGKNWRIAGNKTLSKKLKIPYDILIEIKLKYCPYTRKEVSKQKKEDLLSENAGIILSEEATRENSFRTRESTIRNKNIKWFDSHLLGL